MQKIEKNIKYNIYVEKAQNLRKIKCKIDRIEWKVDESWIIHHHFCLMRPNEKKNKSTVHTCSIVHMLCQMLCIELQTSKPQQECYLELWMWIWMSISKQILFNVFQAINNCYFNRNNMIKSVILEQHRLILGEKKEYNYNSIILMQNKTNPIKLLFKNIFT